MITIDRLKIIFNNKGYKWFNNQPNIIGIRTTLDLPNHFNDVLVCVFPNNGKEEMKQWVITTDPGTDYLISPLNNKGCSILIPNQYESCYALGFHQRKQEHPALVQVGAVSVYRDNNKDNKLDFTNPEKGLFGINIHRANAVGTTARIGKWSAGCQVFQTRKDLDELLSICERFRATTGNKFTYTLILEEDLSNGKANQAIR